jgi:hypothetical protein
MLVKNPGFTIPAVLCLALGIGACTAILSVVNAVLVRPLPYTDPQQLVAIDEYNLEKAWTMGVSNMLLLDLREQTQSFEGIALSHSTTGHLTGGEFPEKIRAARVSTNMFKVLGAEPSHGRTFLPGEDQPGKDDVVVISHSLWQRRFGGDPNLVGQRISFTDMAPRFIEWIGDDIKDKVYTVIGIMPPRFLPVRTIGSKCEMWVPLVFQPDESDDRNIRVYGTVGRLRGDASRPQAQAEVDLLAQRLAEKYPDIYKSWTIQLSPLRNTFVFGDIRKRLSILLVAHCLCQCHQHAARSRHFKAAGGGCSRDPRRRQMACDSAITHRKFFALAFGRSFWTPIGSLGYWPAQATDFRDSSVI